jgi:hypothetical protein
VAQVLDSVNGSWVRGAHLLKARSHFGLAAVGGTLYAVGGNSSASSEQCECGDPAQESAVLSIDIV